MSDERELSRLMRDGMAAEARRVSAGAEFTERVIGTALALERTEPDWSEQRRPGWRNWVLPVAAAVIVGLLVGSVLIGTSVLHSSRHSPAAGPSPTPTAPVPTTSAPTPTPAPSSTGITSQPPSSQPAGPAGGPVPVGFRPYDLTWVSDDEGWALGTAPCSNAPCTSIVRTTDGGAHWVGIPAPRAFLAGVDECASACDLVAHLRFATPLIGYAYGSDAFYLTTNGGTSWARQPGFAYALEVTGGSVLRVTAQAANCAPGCQFQVQRAAVGGTSWQDVRLPGEPRQVGVDLAVNGGSVALASYANPAGGASNASAVLFTSRDGGLSWRTVGEPCPRRGGTEYDTGSVTVAADGSVSVLCRPRGQGSAVTLTAPDGAHFSAGQPLPDPAVGGLVAATSASGLFVLTADRLYRSTDGGRHWSAVAGGPAGGSAIGFESATVGRVAGGNQVWTTTDGGRSWHRHVFG
ncbi:MAG TPA: hypothetical protein VMB79_02815 [Jatrophihabitans sp.]|nr:hypothetical protein [Jatrophihabitans sp.]